MKNIMVIGAGLALLIWAKRNQEQGYITIPGSQQDMLLRDQQIGGYTVYPGLVYGGLQTWVA